jgi:CAAX protease family protein
MLFPPSWMFFPYILLMIFLGGGQEEFGWRAYALPILEKKFGIWLANIILGIIHAFWHLPLWFINGTSQTYMNFGGFILLILGYSFILSWIRKISGNRPASGLYAHGLANAFIPLMPTVILQKKYSAAPFLDLYNTDIINRYYPYNFT